VLADLFGCSGMPTSNDLLGRGWSRDDQGVRPYRSARFCDPAEGSEPSPAPERGDNSERRRASGERRLGKAVPVNAPAREASASLRLLCG
jgi:hypothetical protein